MINETNTTMRTYKAYQLNNGVKFITDYPNSNPSDDNVTFEESFYQESNEKIKSAYEDVANGHFSEIEVEDITIFGRLEEKEWLESNHKTDMKTYKDIHEIRAEVADSINTHQFATGTLEILDRAIAESDEDEIQEFINYVNENEGHTQDHWSHQLVNNPDDFFSLKGV